MDSYFIHLLMENQDLYDDFEATFMGNSHRKIDQNYVYNNLYKKLNFKKQILESFKDYLEVVIKSIDDGEYNEKMIDELCDLIDGYYKNNGMEEEQKVDNDQFRLQLFSKPAFKENNEDYESDSQSTKTSKSSTKVNNKNNETDNDTSDSDEDDNKNALARFLDSDDDTPSNNIKKIIEQGK